MARQYAETIGTVFNVKGRVDTVAQLPQTGNKVGDLYLVGLETDPDLQEYAWLSFEDSARWERLGTTTTSSAFSALTGSPYDNAQLKQALDAKQATLTTGQLNAANSGITSTKVTKYDGYEATITDAQEDITQNMADIASLQTSKQDTVSDLATIRSGAAAGATAVQPSAITDMETKTHASATYQPKGDYATTPSVDTKLDGKQDKLTAGANITITNNVISATGGAATDNNGLEGDY